jgi:crotonobetainyl-CoA:carnitine CoA-transferase CaiB-like acyl-CoA transferase
MTQLPLRGVRILDLSRLLPGPFCTLVLADLGAEVIKVEEPGGGDYLRGLPPLAGDTGAQFLALNRDKRSITLDLKNPAGREVVLRLCERVDVVVESFRPGVLDRLGLGWTALSARNPGLVLLSISGYGQDGPLKERAGHDLDYIALAGLLALWQGASAAPAPPPVQLADLCGGGLWGVIGVCAALYARRESGAGRHLDLSMTEGALALLIPQLAAARQAGVQPRQGEGILGGGQPNYQVYETSDGQQLAVGALEPKFWAALSRALGRPVDFNVLAGPTEERARLTAELRALFRRKTRAEWEALFAAHDACVEPALSLAEVPAHPQHAARQIFFTLDDPRRGALREARTPFGSPEGHSPAPALGEHTEAILREAGYGDEEIAALKRSGALG